MGEDAIDILTKKGQMTVAQEIEAAEIFMRKYPMLIYNHTPKGKAAIVDAVVTHVKNMIVEGIVETKCRVNMHIATLMRDYDGEWLVTHEKITQSIAVANALKVPLVGFLYFPQDKQLLFETLWKPEKGWMVKYRVETTTTQKTVNGGTARRENIFMDMTKAKVIE